MNTGHLLQIRESERKSHIEMYSNSELFKEGSWLRKPIKTILNLLPEFKDYKELNVLDLGCGVGRNCIANRMVTDDFREELCRLGSVKV